MANIDNSTSHYFILPQDVIVLKDHKEGVYNDAVKNLVKLHKAVYGVDLLKAKPEHHYGKKKGILW